MFYDYVNALDIVVIGRLKSSKLLSIIEYHEYIYNQLLFIL